MSTQYYIYLSDSEPKSVSEAKIRSCFTDLPLGVRYEHRTDDEFSGDDAWSAMIKDEHGFFPDWEIIISPNKQDVSGSNIQFANALHQMLEIFDGDILALSGSDLLMLSRINGKTSIINEDAAWEDSMLGVLSKNP